MDQQRRAGGPAPPGVSGEVRDEGSVVGGGGVASGGGVGADAGDLGGLGVHGVEPGEQGVADQDVVDEFGLAQVNL